MQRFLELCKLKNPTVPASLTEFIVNAYVELRKESREFTSARSLLSILRLASAVAKLKLADSVTRDDVQEAMRLVEMSKDSLKGTKAKKRRRQRPSDMIYQEIREMLPPAPAAPTIKMADARNRAIARGFTNDQFEEAGHDASSEGEAVRRRQEGRRQEDRWRGHGQRAGRAQGDDQDQGAAGGGEKDLAQHPDQAPRARRHGRRRPEGEGQRAVGGDCEA